MQTSADNDLAPLYQPAVGEIGEVLEWTSADGRKLTAKLETITKDGVLISANGKRFTLRLDALSEGDREFVASLAQRVEGDEVRSQGFRRASMLQRSRGNG